ncbi:hypothetical protein FB567DRAFT_628289 [Paraphoma chrysanthemicola]|uniref:Transmembrane protein n=1 Tax=Paraphoma chrysanthemicola TaxID=798071 RepID=A0A8K0R607_9PLEO|nr:hypothetical protein FB567DRAFT_628289 [Paraphoma chrysanthemicola]
MNSLALPFLPSITVLFIVMGHFYNSALALPITADIPTEPYSPYQKNLPRNGTADGSTQTNSRQPLLTIISSIIGVIGGVFTVGCFVVAVKQYRRPDMSTRLEELIMSKLPLQHDNVPDCLAPSAFIVEPEQHRAERPPDALSPVVIVPVTDLPAITVATAVSDDAN